MKLPKKLAEAIDEMCFAYPNDYVVVLKGYGNPDYDQYKDVAPAQVVHAATLRDAVNLCELYIGMFDLGGGNWGELSGRVWQLKWGTMASCEARISYTGKVFHPITDEEIKI